MLRAEWSELYLKFIRRGSLSQGYCVCAWWIGDLSAQRKVWNKDTTKEELVSLLLDRRHKWRRYESDQFIEGVCDICGFYSKRGVSSSQ
jgi:hypothetical protein